MHIVCPHCTTSYAIDPANLGTAGRTVRCSRCKEVWLARGIWRVGVARPAPQAAAFYKMVGLEVNMRGLAFKDVKITSETMEGKPVLVIEGVIVGLARKPVELPRLRFFFNDTAATEIYT